MKKQTTFIQVIHFWFPCIDNILGRYFVLDKVKKTSSEILFAKSLYKSVGLFMNIYCCSKKHEVKTNINNTGRKILMV